MAGVFAVAVVGKLYNPTATLKVFTGFAALSDAAASAALICLVAAETLVAGWLLSGLFRRTAFAVAAVFLVLFTVVLAWQQIAGWTGGCGCGWSAFGPTGDRLFGITRNLACLGLCRLGGRR